MAGIVIRPRSRIFHGHDWVYSSEVHKTFGNPQPGDVISLKDFKDRRLGTGIYNPASQIVARRFSRRPQELDGDFFCRRLQRAQALRETMGFDDCVYRLVWSESDGLPGVIIDRYENHFVLQTLTLAMDQRKALIVEALVKLFSPESVIERNDSPIRKAEELSLEKGVLHGVAPGKFHVKVSGVTFAVDPLDGHKTGLYLDQFGNYQAVAALAKDRRVLDCFCNEGGFALHCALNGAQSVLAVDSSEPALECGRENAATNQAEIEFSNANVFDFLKNRGSDPALYDLVILDPPSFTRSRKSVKDALRGYKEIHLRALKLLDKNGILATFCCSHHVDRQLFLDTICEAAVDAKSTLRLLSSHSQRLDHPVVPTLPESEYLKGFVFQKMAAW
jgi:23S rRNA (cytosine1962-C5)-methyltransferase